MTSPLRQARSVPLGGVDVGAPELRSRLGQPVGGAGRAVGVHALQELAANQLAGALPGAVGYGAPEVGQVARSAPPDALLVGVKRSRPWGSAVAVQELTQVVPRVLLPHLGPERGRQLGARDALLVAR